MDYVLSEINTEIRDTNRLLMDTSRALATILECLRENDYEQAHETLNNCRKWLQTMQRDWLADADAMVLLLARQQYHMARTSSSSPIMPITRPGGAGEAAAEDVAGAIVATSASDGSIVFPCTAGWLATQSASASSGGKAEVSDDA